MFTQKVQELEEQLFELQRSSRQEIESLQIQVKVSSIVFFFLSSLPLRKKKTSPSFFCCCCFLSRAEFSYALLMFLSASKVTCISFEFDFVLIFQLRKEEKQRFWVFFFLISMWILVGLLHFWVSRIWLENELSYVKRWNRVPKTITIKKLNWKNSCKWSERRFLFIYFFICCHCCCCWFGVLDNVLFQPQSAPLYLSF